MVPLRLLVAVAVPRINAIIQKRRLRLKHFLSLIQVFLEWLQQTTNSLFCFRSPAPEFFVGFSERFHGWNK